MFKGPHYNLKKDKVMETCKRMREFDLYFVIAQKKMGFKKINKRNFGIHFNWRHLYLVHKIIYRVTSVIGTL